MQVSVLSAVITHLHVMPTSAVARVLVAGLETLLIVVLVALWLRGVSWLQTGWGGVDAEEMRYVARQLRHEGRDTAAIGYQMFPLADRPARWNVIDPRYKVGAELDLIFTHQHDISNTTRCAEGVSPDDEYRIVQTRAEGFWAASRHRFDASRRDVVHLVERFDVYEVFRRQPGADLHR